MINCIVYFGHQNYCYFIYGKWKKNQKVLSDSSGKDSGSVPMKEEECYYTNGKSYYKIGGSNKKGNNFGKSRKVAVTRKGIIWKIKE